MRVIWFSWICCLGFFLFSKTVFGLKTAKHTSYVRNSVTLTFSLHTKILTHDERKKMRSRDKEKKRGKQESPVNNNNITNRAINFGMIWITYDHDIYRVYWIKCMHRNPVIK